MDGMDVAICKLNKEKMELEFAGAHRPLYLLRGEEVIVYKGDRKPIGGTHLREQGIKFTNHKIPVQPGDAFFIFSDGLQDQFGGPTERKKKYSSKRIRETLIKHNNLPMDQMKNAIEKDFLDWMGKTKQVDDVLLIGVKF